MRKVPAGGKGWERCLGLGETMQVHSVALGVKRSFSHSEGVACEQRGPVAGIDGMI